MALSTPRDTNPCKLSLFILSFHTSISLILLHFSLSWGQILALELHSFFSSSGPQPLETLFIHALFSYFHLPHTFTLFIIQGIDTGLRAPFILFILRTLILGISLYSYSPSNPCHTSISLILPHFLLDPGDADIGTIYIY